MIRALLAALALAHAAMAAAQELRAEGNCREGLPHGAYELRGAAGQIRAAGAFARGKRTGSFLFWSSAGARVALLPFDDDRLSGTLALWYPPTEGRGEGKPKLEVAYAAGKLSGLKRSWYPNGRPRAEFRYDNGELVGARAFSEAGGALAERQALAMAARDAAADDAYLESLEAIVRGHPPSCDAAADRVDRKHSGTGGGVSGAAALGELSGDLGSIVETVPLAACPAGAAPSTRGARRAGCDPAAACDARRLTLQS